jgi:glutaconate CoA-transferase subunit B
MGLTTEGPVLLITDLAVWEPHPETKEFTVTSLHPGVSAEQVQENCGWQVRFAENLRQTPPPTDEELTVLRELKARTKAAHEGTRQS